MNGTLNAEKDSEGFPVGEDLKLIIAHLEELEKREGYVSESTVFGDGDKGRPILLD